MRYLPVLLMVLLLGCGKPPTASEAIQAPEDVLPYVIEYFQIVSHEPTHGEIVIATPPLPSNPLGKTVGLCIPDSPWKIYLDPDYWRSFSETDRRILVYHELTHCTFNSGKHSPDPMSYMNAYSPASHKLDSFSLSDIQDQVLNYTSNL